MTARLDVCRHRGAYRRIAPVRCPRDQLRLPGAGPILKTVGIPRTRSSAIMCRNIRTLYHFEPPVTDDEIRAASLQFVRKVSGFTRPSAANQAPFEAAVDEVSIVVRRLLDSLVTTAPAKNREAEAAKARDRGVARAARTGAAGQGR